MKVVFFHLQEHMQIILSCCSSYAEEPGILFSGISSKQCYCFTKAFMTISRNSLQD